jgi:hypothetical protein
MKRFAIAGIIAAGFGSVAVSLFYLYLDFRAREGAWVEATYMGPGPDSGDRERIMSAWEHPDTFALMATFGAVGLTLIAFGVMLLVFELRMFNKAQPGN